MSRTHIELTIRTRPENHQLLICNDQGQWSACLLPTIARENEQARTEGKLWSRSRRAYPCSCCLTQQAGQSTAAPSDRAPHSLNVSCWEGHLSTRTRSLISHLFNTVISKGVFKCPGQPCSLPSRQAWKTAAVSHNPSSSPRSFSQAPLLKIRSFQSKLIPPRSNLLFLDLSGKMGKRLNSHPFSFHIKMPSYCAPREKEHSATCCWQRLVTKCHREEF